MRNHYLKDELYELIKEDHSIFDFIQSSILNGLWYRTLEIDGDVWLNDTWWRSMGYDPDHLPDHVQKWEDIIDPAELNRAFESVKAYFKNPQGIYEETFCFIHQSGHKVYMLCKAQIIRKNGQPHRMLGILSDVTELKRKEIILEECNTSALIGYWELDPIHERLYWSSTTKEIHGVAPDYEPILGTAIDFYEEGPHRDRILKAVTAAIQTGQSYNEELQIVTAKGEHKWVRAIGHSEMVDGKCLRHYGTFQDINDIKKKEEALHQSLSLNRIFVEQSPSAIAMFDTQMRYLAASNQWLSDYKLEGMDLIGKSHYEVFPEIGDEWKAHHQRALKGEILINNEDRFERADGSVQWIKWEVRPWYSAPDTVGGILMYTGDITQEKENIEKLRVNEESFRRTFENAAIGIAMLDPEGKWLKVNANLCKMIGYTAEELTRLTFQDITHPEDLNADLELFKQLVDGEIPYYHMEKRYFHKNGSIVYIILSASAIRDDAGDILYFISQITDITASKIAEQERNRVLSRLQSVLNASTQVSIIGSDPEGNITTFNSGAENLLGYTQEEMLGKTPIVFHVLDEVIQRGKELSREYQTTIEGFETFVHKARLGQHETREWTYVRKDGSRFPVQLTVTAQYDGETIIGYLGIAADISGIKEAEKNVSELLYVTQDQNARLKNFAQIVSHNLRSHATNFSLLLDLLEMESPEFKENEIIKMLSTASNNLQETIMHLNEVVQINTANNQAFQNISLSESVEKTLLSISAQILETKATIENKVSKKFTVTGFQAYMDSILLNLLTNALRYRSLKQQCIICIDAIELDDEYIELSISDNGVGMDLEKYGDRLFGMYKTFHNHPESRGIGLFITKNQIEAMGGSIHAESKPNKGSTFYLRLRKAHR